MIEIYLLEQLSAFQQYGTLSAAAEHLNIAQPSLSRSMQKIEGILGVSLFERQKNRIVLNDTGILAAQYAQRILESEAEMERHIKAFDRSLHTLSIGSCAPGPLMLLLPQATAVFPDLTISSGVKPEDVLLKGLETAEYSLILLQRPLNDPKYFCRKYRTEQLYLSVTPFHPAAAYKTISFAEMDGQKFIMHDRIGIWDEVVHKKMPASQFLLQSDLDVLVELSKHSDLPSFSTDITQSLTSASEEPANRVDIPFSDPESCVTYYFICKRAETAKWKPLFGSLQE